MAKKIKLLNISDLKIMYAIGCITILETVAMLKGIDGMAFGVVISVIAGMVGYQVKTKMVNKK